MSLPNGASNLPSATLPFFSKFKKIYLWMDADQAGMNATNNFAKKLGESRTWIINSRRNNPNGPKDANDCLKEGVCLKKLVEEAILLSSDNIVQLADIKSEVLLFLTKYDTFTGYKSKCFDFFNKDLKGLRMGELTVLTGETGSGKTTFLTQLSLDFITQVY